MLRIRGITSDIISILGERGLQGLQGKQGEAGLTGSQGLPGITITYRFVLQNIKIIVKFISQYLIIKNKTIHQIQLILIDSKVLFYSISFT